MKVTHRIFPARLLWMKTGPIEISTGRNLPESASTGAKIFATAF
jgi:hypothetical protein